MRNQAYRAGCLPGDDAHDGRELLPAQRAPPRLIPQRRRAPDAEPSVPALEQDGVGRPLHAHDAGVRVVSIFKRGTAFGWRIFINRDAVVKPELALSFGS